VLFDGSAKSGTTRAQVAAGKWRGGVQDAESVEGKGAELGAAKLDGWQAHVFEFRPVDGAMSIRHSAGGAEEKGTLAGAGALSWNGFILGADVATANGLECDVAEVLVYDRTLDAAEAKEVTGYLEGKWGSPKELPAARQPKALAPVEDARVFRTVVRKHGDDGVHTYRIPGLATSPKGTLLAVFDIRYAGGGDLPGDIDVGLMRSTDEGATWGPMKRILDFDKAVPESKGNGVGDPAILVDHKRGAIFVAGLWSKGNRAWNGSQAGMTPDETGQLVITKSTDDGETWSAPVNITQQVKDPVWRLCFQGPGNGIQLRDGTLVFPAQFRHGGGTPHSCFIFSTDGGDHWRISPAALPEQPPTSESAIAQCADGSLLLSMRNESRSGQRAWARWEWKGDISRGAWSRPWFDLPDPTCMASLVSHPKGALVFSNPADTKQRMAMTVRTSADNGATWNAGRLLDPRPAAYSCMTVLKDGSVGILYECGDASSISTLTFARFPLDWVTSAPQKAAPPVLPKAAKASADADLASIKERIANPGEPLTWLITGDSITHGAKHTLGARSYPEHFAERVRFEMNRRRDVVINTGISGDTSDGILKDFEWRVGRYKPDVVSINIGMNDCARGAGGRDNFTTHLRELVRRTRALGAVPVLQTTNTIAADGRRGDLAAFVGIIQKVAKDEGVILVDHWSHWQKQGDVSAWLNDPIHPNATGHAEMAKVMFRALGIFDAKSPTCQLGAK
jgi:sialidase-1